MNLRTTMSSIAAGVLRNPMEIESPQILNSEPTSSVKISQHIENSMQNTTISSIFMTNSSHEGFESAVLSVPMAHTTPMTVIMSASSSPIVDTRSRFDESRNFGFVIIPVILLLCLALISGIIFYCVQRRKKLDALRHRLIPVYNFAPGEEDEWGVLLDNPEHCHSPR